MTMAVALSGAMLLWLTLREGRGISDRDMKGAPPVTVINETMARKYFAGENAIGKRILVQEIVPGKTQLGPEIPWEVVGIIRDEKVGSVDDTRESLVAGQRTNREFLARLGL